MTAIIKKVNDRLQVSGVLSPDTVVNILRESKPFFKDARALNFDFGAVSHAHTAGLSLMFEWLRMADKAGIAVTFYAIPEHLRRIARLSGVEEIILSHGGG